MATNRTIVNFRVLLVDSDSVLAGLRIQRTERVERVSEDGKVLDYGHTVDVGDALEVPLNNLSDLVRELVEWPICATGVYDQ